jgi:hypothetical protein
MRVRTLVIPFVAAAALVAAGPALPAAGTGGAPLSAALTGANEVPGPGDPDGSGTAELTVNPGTRTVCWTIATSGLGTFTGAHIHRGTAAEAGPIVVHLAPIDGGCTTADRELLTEILRDPAAFYVNVHTTEFRAGAVHGQLVRG